MPPWKSVRKGKRRGQHFKTKGRTMFGPARYKKYADIISIRTPLEAQSSANQMLKEFNDAYTRAKKVRVKRALVQAANRAGVASRNTNLSERERREMAEVVKIYNSAKDKMVLPAKISKTIVKGDFVQIPEHAKGTAWEYAQVLDTKGSKAFIGYGSRNTSRDLLLQKEWVPKKKLRKVYRTTIGGAPVDLTEEQIEEVNEAWGKGYGGD